MYSRSTTTRANCSAKAHTINYNIYTVSPQHSGKTLVAMRDSVHKAVVLYPQILIQRVKNSGS